MVNQEPLDQGTIYWPPGHPATDRIHLTFNRALSERPNRIECTLLDTGQPMAIEVVDVPLMGTRSFSHYDHAIIRLTRPEERRQSFRWRAFR